VSNPDSDLLNPFLLIQLKFPNFLKSILIHMKGKQSASYYFQLKKNINSVNH